MHGSRALGEPRSTSWPSSSNEEDITDETDATYTLTADDRGTKVKVEVRFVDILGGEETRTSAPTATLAGTPNTPATGAPTITGTAQVGETLTASTTGIADANGLTSPNYTYLWIRVDGTEADIASANSSTYILVDADLGTTLKVKVTFADDLGHAETLTSAATATVGAVATAPTVNDVAVTSTPASGNTYYLAGEVIEFTVTFSAPVTVTGTPKFAFRLGAATRQTAYASGSDSVALVFARTVQAGEVDRNGISWNALALALDGGTITQTGATTAATTAASLTHAEQAPLEGHRVDAAPPMQVSASVQGMSLVLVYDEPLDPASMPATGAYTVTATVGATTTNPAVSEVSIYGIWVTLTLDAAPAAGATVTLAYAPPASNPVQDEAGNDAPAFSGQSVRLGPPPPPRPDLAQVMGVGVAPGNAQLVVTWTAVDTATGYTVQWTSGSQGYTTGDRQAPVTSGSTTRYTIPSLINGTEYTVRVIATRTGATDGPPSEEMTGTPRVPPPPPPPRPDLAQVMGVGVAPGNAQLVVTWPTELGHLVQDVTRDHGLGHSPASGPGAKPIPENRFVPKERILHPRLELVAGLLLPAAPAERPHVRDRAISRARPRPTPRHPRGLGRWNHDSRVTHLRRFVERDRIVGRVSGHPCDLIVDRLNEVDANGRVIHRRLGQRVSDDHAHSINSTMQRLPASVAASTVFHRSPFAFAHNRQSRAVDDEMDGSSRWEAAECNRERLTASGERGVVGGCEIDTHQRQDRPQEAFRLAHGQPEDKAERQRRLDRTVRERLRRAWSTGRRRAPRVQRIAELARQALVAARGESRSY